VREDRVVADLIERPFRELETRGELHAHHLPLDGDPKPWWPMTVTWLNSLIVKKWRTRSLSFSAR
jgi:hypothetical protein